MHRFSVYDFTPAEITQIVTLVHEWARGRLRPIDQRRYTKQVRTYAERGQLLDRHEGGTLVVGTSRFSPAYDLPVAALWALVEPLLNGQRSKGASLLRDARWLTLNIYPQGHRYASVDTLEEQATILDVLAQHGYLLVQRAGSVWEITRWTTAA
jgi:hypothetical protein